MSNNDDVYLYNDDYKYTSELQRINLDEEREDDIKSNNGFIVKSAKGIKKAIKEPDGVFSTRFGQTLQDMNPFADKYKCECGNIMGRIYNGVTCKECKTEVKFVDDDLSYFGWITLKEEYPIIHPNLYKSMEFLIGSKRLNNIIEPIDEKDQDGFTVKSEVNKDEPYKGISIIGLRDNFDEIMDYYLKKSPKKKDCYDDIMENKEKIFIHSIPVYTTILRPFKEEREHLFYDDTNEIYNMMSRLAHVINTDDLKIFRKNKPRNQSLYNLQMQYNKLYAEIVSILSNKKGRVRTLFGGRCTFSSRNVIVPEPKLRIDQVVLSYYALVELLQQSIINILCKSYNMSYNDAYRIWYRSSIEIDTRIYGIIEGIIKNTKNGIPIIINRNPTINYGGILQMYVVGINKSYTMSVPLQILKTMGAEIGSYT